MADLQGTNITAPVRPYTDQDPIPTHYANEGLGGHHQKDTLAARDAILPERRLRGMTCFVEEDGVTYTLVGGVLNQHWTDTGLPLAGRTTVLESAVTALQHQPLVITGLTVTPSLVETGTTVTSVAFAWGRNRVPASLAFDQGVGAVVPPTLTALTAGVSITADVADTVFTLTADDGTGYPGHEATATAVLRFQQRMRWGSAVAASLSSAAILALPGSAFATGRARAFTVAGEGGYVYFAYPASFGQATVRVGGMATTAFIVEEVLFTNASGHSEPYLVYRSAAVQHGTLSIELL